MNMRLFISELMSGNNQYNQLNRFFFHLTPSGILFMIFSLILFYFSFYLIIIFLFLYQGVYSISFVFSNLSGFGFL